MDSSIHIRNCTSKQPPQESKIFRFLSAQITVKLWDPYISGHDHRIILILYVMLINPKYSQSHPNPTLACIKAVPKETFSTLKLSNLSQPKFPRHKAFMLVPTYNTEKVHWTAGFQMVLFMNCVDSYLCHLMGVLSIC